MPSGSQPEEPRPIKPGSTLERLRVVDRLLETHLRGSPFPGRALANLAVAMAAEYSGARGGMLLLDQGDGMAPVMSVGSGRWSDPSRSRSRAHALLEELMETGEPAVEGHRLAVPIRVGDDLRGVLYLEGSAEAAVPDAEFAAAVALRIGAILHNAKLTEELSRQRANLGMLETLGARLSIGAVREEDLDRLLEAALRGTESRGGVLATLDHTGRLATLRASGHETDRLRTAATHVASQTEGLKSGAPLELDLPGHHLCESIWSARATDEAAATTPLPAGFLLVQRREPGRYDDDDRSFLQALANLLGGALARHDYRRHAVEDPLTGIGSRFALELVFGQLKALAERNDQPLALVLADLDDFKKVNDTHGHLVGDLALQEVASLLRSRLRDQDFVGRYGGDEFVLLLPATGGQGAVRIVGDLCELIARSRLTDLELGITFSAGIALYPSHGVSLEEILRHADRALYDAKRSRRGGVVRPAERSGAR